MADTTTTGSAASRDQTLADIAQRVFGVPTLESRGSDHLDFYDIAVWSVLEALRLAWSAGQEQAIGACKLDAGAVAASDACPSCGERSTDRLVWVDEDEVQSVRCTTCGISYLPPQSSAVDQVASALAVCEALSQYAHNLYEDIPADLAAIVADARAVTAAAREE